MSGIPRRTRSTSLSSQSTPDRDVSAEVLLVATGQRRSDPTGMIAYPHPCNVRYSTAYSFYQPELTKYARSECLGGGSPGRDRAAAIRSNGHDCVSAPL